MPQEYDAFVDDPPSMPEGEIVLDIRELTPSDRRKKYRARYVSAVINRNPDRERDDLLWLRYRRGARLHPQPFRIKITAESGPYHVPS